MSDITPDTFPRTIPHPLVGNLPEHLKDPKNYQKIRKALLETLASTHSHSDITEWAGCTSCMERMQKHGDLVRKLGFTSTAQFRAWLKVHEIIETRVKLR